MNNTVNLNTANNQVNFGCKNKTAYKIIDSMNDRAVELLNKNRPFEEKKEIALRKSISNFLKNFGFKLNKSSEISKQIERESMEDIGRFIKDV